MAFGWLRDLRKLFARDAGMYREFDLPPVRIWPFDPAPLVDLRALADPDRALGAGLRVAVEMCRTEPPALHRLWFFAPPTVEALLADGARRLRAIAPSLHVKVPRGGEIALLIEPARIAAAAAAWGGLDLLAVPCRGPGSSGIEDTVGAPPAAGYTIAHPPTMPDLCGIDGVPGVAIRLDDEVILDLRRVGRDREMALMMAVVAARLALPAFDAPRRRTWIVAPWMFEHEPGESVIGATREALAVRPPSEGDQLVVDGDASDRLRGWAERVGLRLHEAPRPITPGLELPYPQLAQHIMLARALEDPAT